MKHVPPTIKRLSVSLGVIVWGIVGVLTNPVDAVPLTPAFVQNDVAFSGSASTTISTAFPSPNTVGNFIVAYVVWDSTTAPSPTVTDTVGNTYAAVGVPSTTVNNSSGQLFYAKNIAAGANTVTATFSSSANFRFLYIHEYTNVDKTNPFDQSANANGFGTAVDSGPFTTTSPTELLVSGSMTFDAQSAGVGWTSRSTFSSGLTQDRVVTSTGSYNATATVASNQSWMIQAASFRAAQVPPSAPSVAPALQGGGTTATDSTPSLVGSCTNGDIVTIYVNGTAATPTQVCSGGAYAITLANALANGTYSITSSFSDEGGTSSLSPVFTLIVNAPPAPLAPNAGAPRIDTSLVWLLSGCALLGLLASVSIIMRQRATRYRNPRLNL